MTSAEAALRSAQLLDLGRPVDAERILRAALASDPDQPELLRLLGRSLLEQRRLREARDVLREAAAAAPSNAMVHGLAAAAAFGLGRTKDARSALERAVGLDPNGAHWHAQLAELDARQGQHASAQARIVEAMRLEPNDPSIRVSAAEVLFASRQTDVAERAARDALALDPDHDGAHHMLARIALRRGSAEAAHQASRSAARQDPQDLLYRETVLQALRARSAWYRSVWRFSDWALTAPGYVRLALFIGPWLTVRLVSQVSEPAAVALAVTWWILLLTVWAAEPVANSLLLLRQGTRDLLPRPARRATATFVVGVTAAALLAAWGLWSGQARWFAVALAWVGFGFVAGVTHLVALVLPRLAGAVVGFAAALALVATALVALAAPTAALGVTVALSVLLAILVMVCTPTIR